MKKLLLFLVSFVVFSALHGQSYLGFVSKSVNLREGPGKEFNILLTLNAGTKIFIISQQAENEFLNVIDIET